MTHPFSQEPVEAALFEALLSRRRSLVETGDPLKAKRLLKEIKSISHTADLLLFSGVSEHMNVACDDILNCGGHQRVVLASAVLKPAFLTPQKFESTGLAKMDGEQAGTFLTAAEVEDLVEQKTKASNEWMEGRQGYRPKADGQMEGREAPSLKMEGKEAPLDGWEAGTFVIRGTKTGQIKIEMAEGQGYPHIGTPSPQPEADGQALSDWEPMDDVAEGQAPIHTTAPSLGKRRIGRHLWRIKS